MHWLNQGSDDLAKGQALSVGRKTRSVPPAIRRALQRRDRGCRFPGCTCCRFVDAHHIQHWADGGATDINNLVLLCRHHHRLVHEGGFSLIRTPAGEHQFTDPKGNRLSDAPKRRFRGDVFELVDNNKRNGITITAETPIPDWLGESMDVDIVVHHLKKRE